MCRPFLCVNILNADGTEVEKGYAVKKAGTNEWIFTAKKANASLDGDKIVVSASDISGNISEKEEVKYLETTTAYKPM
jgi:hypothetical protein